MIINGVEFSNFNTEQTAVASGKNHTHREKINNTAPLVTLENLGCKDESLIQEGRRVYDSWQNQVASIGLNNSVQQYTEYTFQRLPYQQCAAYATDPIIHKALEVITEECFSKGGKFLFASEDDIPEFDINEFNKEFKNEGFYNIAKQGFYNSLVFGGGFIYINTTDNDLTKQLYLDEGNNSKFVGFKNLEAWQYAPAVVNTYNPLLENYMKPSEWYVMGAGTVNSSRFIPVITFPVSDLYKPLFNYMGLALTFFMKDYVATADTIRQSLGDLFLRFATIIIKAPNHKLSNAEGYARVKHILETRNNLGAVILAQDEEYVVDNMSIGGLSDIVQHAYELVTATSYVPTVKLLGIEPSGFNSTGEFSIKNFYDNISAFQNNILTPVLVSMAEAYISLKYSKRITVNYEWNQLGQLDESAMQEVRNNKLTYLLQLKDADILTAEEVLQALQADDMTLSNIDASNLPDDELDIDEDMDEPSTADPDEDEDEDNNDIDTDDPAILDK